MNALLEVVGLNVSIPSDVGSLHLVRNVDLVINRGEVLGIVGESGSGKSLTSLAIIDLLPPRISRTATSIRFDGVDLTHLSTHQIANLRGDRISMIFQDPMTSLNPVFTIGEQLEETYLQHRGGPRHVARDRALELLGRVGIPAPVTRLRQYPHQLSGGIRQRVMIAMALMCSPDLIIADEPTTALDATIQAQILLLLQRLQRAFGMAVIFITHDLGVVARLANRVLVMYAGEVVEHGSIRDIFEKTSHPYTRALISCEPVPGRGKRRLGTIPGMVPSPAELELGCSFAGRCQFANDACRVRPIPLSCTEEVGHFCRCLLTRVQQSTRQAAVTRSGVDKNPQ